MNVRWNARKYLPWLLRSTDGIVVFCTGLLLLLRLRAHVIVWARDLAAHVPASKLEPAERVLAIEAAVPSTTYIVSGVVFGVATLLAAIILRVLSRFSFKSQLSASLVLPLVVAVCMTARKMASFWTWPALALVIALAPLFASGRYREQPDEGTRLRQACVLGVQAGCAFLTFALPYGETAAALFVPAFALGFAGGALFSVSQPALGDEVSRAALPVLLLPLLGLRRAPTLTSPLWVVALVVVTFVVARRWRFIGEGLTRARDRWGVDVALTAATFLFIVPMRFRDLPAADSGGHESQHLGWINSFVHGRLMMADAGFIYGPLREYTLGAIAWLYGGLTLEHVRLAQVTVNILGVLLLIAAARRAARGRIAITALAAVLLLSHSAAVALVNYAGTIALGWVDELRAGLATLSVVLALTRSEGGNARWRVRGAGILAGLATLYSHDFGVLATAATLLGLASEHFAGRGTQRSKLGATATRLGDYLAGLAIPMGIFVVVYLAFGKLGGLVMGARWSVRVGAGLLRTAVEPYPLEIATLVDKTALLEVRQDQLGTSMLDYLVVPAIPLVGIGCAVATGVLRGWTRRSSMLLALSTFVALAMRHPLVSADGWHIANASGPCVVLVAAMVDEAGHARLPVTTGRIGSLFAGALAAAWLLTGAGRPLTTRLARLTSGEERPSFGDKYVHADVPRAGDMLVEEEHLALARYAMTNTQPNEPILATTWLLGGGIEAFLSNRRNAVPFDVPHECQTDAQKAEAFGALVDNRPRVIIGAYTTDFGPEVDHWIHSNYQQTSVPGAATPVFVLRDAKAP